MKENHFDAEYYRRYYEHPGTAIMSAEAMRAEVAFVIAFCNHIELAVARFADVGAGTGWWAREFAQQYPHCREIETFDASPEACRLYGHRHSVLQKLGGKAADLVVCRDVLRYLDDADASAGIERLARKCRGVLYLHVITRDDEFDTRASDMAGWFRPVAWYRRRLERAGFIDCGMGLHVSPRFRGFSPWRIEVR